MRRFTDPGSTAHATSRLRHAWLAALVVALVALAAACSGSDDASESAGAAEESAVDDGDGDGAFVRGDGGDAGAAREPGDDVAALPDATLVASARDMIVREGTMRLQVDEDGFDPAFARVVTTAERYGGSVLSSDATTSDDAGLSSGSVTVRVPAEDYDALLTAVARIGTVKARATTSEDVSDEYVDLEARLRHNESQERFYLGLLDDAEDVDDAVAVQQRVEGIQQTIEQLKGRLRFLDERTSYSRLTVELFEAGTTVPSAQGRPSLAHYWQTALDALVTVAGTALVVATVVVPFALVALALALVARRLGWGVRRPAAAGAPAPPGPPAPTGPQG